MAMIKVRAGTTLSMFEEIVEDSTTLQAFVDKHQLATPGSTLQLDGRPVQDLNKKFSEVVSGTECMLFSIVNSKNA